MKNFNIKNLLILICTIAYLFLVPTLSTRAEQHSSINKILQNLPQCGPVVYFSPYEINSRSKYYAYYAELEKIFPTNQKTYGMAEAKDLNLIPLDKCILKGNKNFSKLNNAEFLKKIEIKTLINTDYISHNFNGGNSTYFTYVFLPISQSGIQNRETLKSIKLALDYLSTAKPTDKIYLGCLYGKYQSSLLAATYQFLHEYSKNKETACKQVGGDNDKAFIQMTATGDEGLLSHNTPNGLKKIYLGLAKAICEEKSAEFLQ